jgi:hypothetical protein
LLRCSSVSRAPWKASRVSKIARTSRVSRRQLFWR